MDQLFYRIRTLAFPLIILCAAVAVHAQETIEYVISNDSSELTFSGDASVNDFSVTADTIRGSVRLHFTGESGNPPVIDSAAAGEVTIPVKSMKGGNFLFNQDMYKTLQAKAYPTIQFVLRALNPVQVDTLNGTESAFKAAGDLTVSGTTRTINFPVVASFLPEKNITVRGKTSLRMSEFNIEPPKKVFGALKVEDEIEIQFNIVLNPAEN